jgi:superfamily II DNA or RNA helicase
LKKSGYRWLPHKEVININELRPYQQQVIYDLQRSWRSGHKRPCIVLPCGGGKSVIAAEIAKRTTSNGKRVEFLVHRRELCEQIENTFWWWGVDMSKCSVDMVQTISRRVGKIEPPDLIITDENHHCLASSYRKVYDGFPSAYCVGLTATPVRLNGGGLGDINDDLIIGPTVKQLIAADCLAPYDYYAPAVADLSGLKSRAGDYSAESLEELLAKPTIYGDVIRHYDSLSAGKKAICYCATIKHSVEVAAAFRAVGIKAEHIDGSTPAADRAAIVDAFRRGDITVLCNVDLISEGFDVPDCNTAILLRPTKSLTLYIQQAMRCMRYQDGKRAIILDHVGNVFRHGLPDTDREWTLEPKKAGTKKCEYPVRQCPECYYTHQTAPECPKCGYVYPARELTAKEQKQAELEKIKELRVERGKGKKLEECWSLQDYQDYAAANGKTSHWAWMKWQWLIRHGGVH